MKITVTGLSDLSRRLRVLPQNVQRVALIKGVKAAAEPIAARARALVPVDTGLLGRSIQIRFRKRGVTRVEAEVGVFSRTRRVKGATVKDDPYYAMWVEFGHTIGVRKSQRALVGMTREQARSFQDKYGARVAARPFLRPAFDSYRGQAVDRIAEAVNVEIEKAGQL